MSRSLVPLLVALAGCDDYVAAPQDPCPPAFSESPDGCVFDEERVLELVRTFDQGDLVKVNAEPFRQIYGSSIDRNVWITPERLDGSAATAVDLYRSIDPGDSVTALAADFPVGTVIVHEAIDREEGHGVQVKREPGFVGPDGRDWWFGKIYDDGTYDENACAPCAACHSWDARPNSDGLVGVPREAL